MHVLSVLVTFTWIEQNRRERLITWTKAGDDVLVAVIPWRDVVDVDAPFAEVLVDWVDHVVVVIRFWVVRFVVFPYQWYIIVTGFALDVS